MWHKRENSIFHCVFYRFETLATCHHCVNAIHIDDAGATSKGWVVIDIEFTATEYRKWIDKHLIWCVFVATAFVRTLSSSILHCERSYDIEQRNACAFRCQHQDATHSHHWSVEYRKSFKLCVDVNGFYCQCAFHSQQCHTTFCYTSNASIYVSNNNYYKISRHFCHLGK